MRFHSFKLGKVTVKSKQENFPVENWPLLLIGYQMELKQLIGRYGAKIQIFWLASKTETPVRMFMQGFFFKLRFLFTFYFLNLA